MRMADRIRQKLEQGLSPSVLEVTDESHLHAGHSGARDGGETHYRVEVVSEDFIGKTRVAQQRLVYALLSEELKERVHALALSTRAPS